MWAHYLTYRTTDLVGMASKSREVHNMGEEVDQDGVERPYPVAPISDGSHAADQRKEEVGNVVSEPIALVEEEAGQVSHPYGADLILSDHT